MNETQEFLMQLLTGMRDRSEYMVDSRIDQSSAGDAAEFYGDRYQRINNVFAESICESRY